MVHYQYFKGILPQAARCSTFSHLQRWRDFNWSAAALVIFMRSPWRFWAGYISQPSQCVLKAAAQDAGGRARVACFESACCCHSSGTPHAAPVPPGPTRVARRRCGGSSETGSRPGSYEGRWSHGERCSLAALPQRLLKGAFCTLALDVDRRLFQAPVRMGISQ